MTYYSDNASVLFEQYHQSDPGSMHADWLQYLPGKPGLACDIGAGTGRDANWLAQQGWEVFAVEPEAAFREAGKKLSHANVAWLDDYLPELSELYRLNQRFDLILLSAVWMHLPEAERERAFRNLTELLAPGGRLVISLRHSSNEEEVRVRGFYCVSVGELEQLAEEREVSLISVTSKPDGQGRDYVSWETMVFQR